MRVSLSVNLKCFVRLRPTSANVFDVMNVLSAKPHLTTIITEQELKSFLYKLGKFRIMKIFPLGGAPVYKLIKLSRIFDMFNVKLV